MIAGGRLRPRVVLIAAGAGMVAFAAGTGVDAGSGSVAVAASTVVPLNATGVVHHSPRASTTEPRFRTPEYIPSFWGDTFFNTVGTANDIIVTSNDTTGLNASCGQRGSNLAVFRARGNNVRSLRLSTINCMAGYGSIAAAQGVRDGCSWKTGGVTRVGHVLYLAVARQLWACSDGRQQNGLQPSFDASIIRSGDGGKTWTNPWGVTSRTGAPPAWDSNHHRYRAMFPGQRFPAPFFIQYGPGNTRTADGAGKYLYAVSTDGYAYNGNFLHLARVPLDKIQTGTAWRYYHGRVGGAGEYWTRFAAGATRILHARHRLSQPAIQYVPALKSYVLVTFFYTRAGRDFPTLAQTPYTRIVIYTAPKPWGPWTHVFDHATQRNLWCAARPCPLIRQSTSTPMRIGTPDDWLGFYDPAIVQKFVFTRPLTDQAIFTSGDWKGRYRYPGENLYRLHAVPFDLRSILRP